MSSCLSSFASEQKSLDIRKESSIYIYNDTFASAPTFDSTYVVLCRSGATELWFVTPSVRETFVRVIDLGVPNEYPCDERKGRYTFDLYSSFSGRFVFYSMSTFGRQIKESYENFFFVDTDNGTIWKPSAKIDFASGTFLHESNRFFAMSHAKSDENRLLFHEFDPENRIEKTLFDWDVGGYLSGNRLQAIPLEKENTVAFCFGAGVQPPFSSICMLPSSTDTLVLIDHEKYLGHGGSDLVVSPKGTSAANSSGLWKLRVPEAVHNGSLGSVKRVLSFGFLEYIFQGWSPNGRMALFSGRGDQGDNMRVYDLDGSLLFRADRSESKDVFALTWTSNEKVLALDRDSNRLLEINIQLDTVRVVDSPPIYIIY